MRRPLQRACFFESAYTAGVIRSHRFGASNALLCQDMVRASGLEVASGARADVAIHGCQGHEREQRLTGANSLTRTRHQMASDATADRCRDDQVAPIGDHDLAGCSRARGDTHLFDRLNHDSESCFDVGPQGHGREVVEGRRPIEVGRWGSGGALGRGACAAQGCAGNQQDGLHERSNTA